MPTLKLKNVFFAGLLMASLASQAQNTKRVDGLLNILNKGCSDSMMVRLNLEIADEFIFNHPDTSRYFALQALERASRISDTLRMAKASNYIGICHYSQGHYLSALEYYQQAELLSRAIGDRSGALKAINNIGIVYTSMGEHGKAIRTYQEAFEENMALGQRENAAYNLFNMAAGYLSLKDINQARYHANRIKLFKRNFPDVKLAENSLFGEIYLEENKPDSALHQFRIAFDHSRAQNDQYFMTSLHISMAKAYLMKKSLLEAELEMYFAGRIIKENNLNNLQLEYLNLMADLYSAQGLFQKAYVAQAEYIALKDSLDQINSIARITELNARYESERQANQIAAQEKLLARRSFQMRLAAMGGGGLCIFAGLVFMNLLRKRKLNTLLKFQNDEIRVQRSKMIASIDYARRIQSAILPSDEILRSTFNDFFVFLKPRDIVSGDIYWCQQADGKLYLAVIDCTGHGVPGAFMSLIAYSKLNTVFSNGYRKPSEILWALHHEVVNMLRQENQADSTQDGMDMSLCCIDPATGTIEYSGANSPVSLWSQDELTEYRLNPFSIGGNVTSLSQKRNGNPFSSHNISFNPGDILFMHTDGIPDQIGGPEARKFNKPRFRNLLAEIATGASLSRAGRVCKKTMEDWREDTPQTDDMLIVGLRL